jgi:hypothetical protein
MQSLEFHARHLLVCFKWFSSYNMLSTWLLFHSKVFILHPLPPPLTALKAVFNFMRTKTLKTNIPIPAKNLNSITAKGESRRAQDRDLGGSVPVRLVSTNVHQLRLSQPGGHIKKRPKGKTHQHKFLLEPECHRGAHVTNSSISYCQALG